MHEGSKRHYNLQRSTLLNLQDRPVCGQPVCLNTPPGPQFLS